jgi:hypothetical protein
MCISLVYYFIIILQCTVQKHTITTAITETGYSLFVVFFLTCTLLDFYCISLRMVFVLTFLSMA